MSQFSNKRIILGITGGIAAYKSADLVRRLKERGADVRVVMTHGAKSFITPLTMQALSGHPVHDDLLDVTAEAGMGHIELARWADHIIIAPASANALARLAGGAADDLLSTVCLASTAPVLLAPAMNQAMWSHAATQKNVQALSDLGYHFVGPAEGSQACGDVGYGRMAEPNDIVAHLLGLVASNVLAGKHVLITAGPTQEPIDPVRYLTNRSSGKMGYALAKSAIAAGARVTLISGPVHLDVPDRVTCHGVRTADEMYDAVMANVSDCDIVIACAAVSDMKPATRQHTKVKKNEFTGDIKVTENRDIVKAVAAHISKPYTVGFAAETSDIMMHAKSKLSDKALDLIFVNEVGEHKGFESDNNAGVAIWDQGERAFALMPKTQLANEIIKLIGENV